MKPNRKKIVKKQTECSEFNTMFLNALGNNYEILEKEVEITKYKKSKLVPKIKIKPPSPQRDYLQVPQDPTIFFKGSKIEYDMFKRLEKGDPTFLKIFGRKNKNNKD